MLRPYPVAGTPCRERARGASGALALLLVLLFVFAGHAQTKKPAADPVRKGDLADKSKSIDMTPALQDYCRLLYGCGLKVPEGTCPSQGVLGKAPFEYDAERCSEAREFTRRGIGPDHPQWGFRLYRFLGFEYRVTYEITDTLPISRGRMEYLVDEIPLAAKLVTHYQGEPYTAEYVNIARTRFKGTNGKRLRGEAERIAGSYDEMRLFYLGSGVVDWGPWTLVGPALMDFKYWEVPGNRVGYKVKILVFPGNGFINGVMNMGLFRNLVRGKITGVLSDISGAAIKLDASGGKDLQAGKGKAGGVEWTASDRQKLAELLKLP